jgi:glycosyltransferase involved in cell wall biosynthesis
MLAIPAQESCDQQALVQRPAVSVIMLAYDHAPWLQQAVESVMCQQLAEPFELLIGEDRSSDITLDLALSLQRRWPERIRVIQAPTNVGIRDNVLRLLVRARAPVVAFLEGDDHWVCDTKLQQQLALLRADPSLSCVAGITQNRPVVLPSAHRDRFQLHDLLRRYAVHSSALMFRTELAIPYPNFPDGAFDSMLLALLASKGDCGMVAEPLSYYRRHPGGYWTGAERGQRLRLSRECIDAIDAFFFNRFRRELVDRELWIHQLDAVLPLEQPWRHWCQTWRLQLAQASRLLHRAPLAYLFLLSQTALQPLLFVLYRLRCRLAIGSRWRRMQSKPLP